MQDLNIPDLSQHLQSLVRRLLFDMAPFEIFEALEGLTHNIPFNKARDLHIIIGMNNFDEGSSSFERGFYAGCRCFGQHLCPTESVPGRAGCE
jgi:hypothetical protein